MRGSLAVTAAEERDTGAWVPERLRVRSAGAGERIWFTNSLMTIKATAESTEGAYGLVEALVPPGFSPPMHIHRREDESFWVLEGTLSVRCGDETFAISAGSYMLLPRDVPHSFVVEGDTPARLLSMCSPGGFEEYFVAVGRQAQSDGLPPAEPVDVGVLTRVGDDFGVEIVGPPMQPAG